jgi:hypothetical protein
VYCGGVCDGVCDGVFNNCVLINRWFFQYSRNAASPYRTKGLRCQAIRTEVARLVLGRGRDFQKKRDVAIKNHYFKVVHLPENMMLERERDREKNWFTRPFLVERAHNDMDKLVKRGVFVSRHRKFF